MRTSHRLFLILIAVLLSVRAGYAQDLNAGAAALGQSIDRQAAANGLLSGDGALSSGEQLVADLIEQGIAEFSQQVADFESASPDNAAFAEAMDQDGGVLAEQVAQAEAGTTVDVRAQIIADAVAQYGQEPSAPVDIRAQIIADAVAQYGRETPSTIDPRAEAISRAVEWYEQHAGEAPRDPRAEAISNAVAQYGQEEAALQGRPALSERDSATLRRAVRDGAHDYVDGSNIRRKQIVRRYVDQLVQIMVPSQMLPINGYWRAQPFSMTQSGQCQALTGDNDGPSAMDDSNPGQPLCGYENPGGLPFIVWESGDHPYLPGTSSIYSQAPETRTELMYDQNGQTIGSKRVTMTREYEVIAPDQIRVHLVMAEENGCTLTGDYLLELVTADESVCAQTPPMSTPEPTQTPPSDTIYRVGLPFVTSPEQCNERNTPPEFDEARVAPQPDGSMLLDYGTGSQTLYQAGDRYYTFEGDTGDGARTVISLTLLDDGSASIFWSVNTRDGNICSVSLPLEIPGTEGDESASTTPTATPAPIGVGSSGDQGQAVNYSLHGRFRITWNIMDMLCPPDMQSMLPGWAEATLAQPDTATLTFDVEAASFTLSDMTGSGQYAYFDMSDPAQMIVMSVSPTGPGTASLSWTGMPTDGDGQKMCIAMADLEQID
ncbi:MAG: hypothetical protein IT320_17405 [Anaerolineae bacterium]|nr:hypothetical protein [Anaerolineae bacterium]